MTTNVYAVPARRPVTVADVVVDVATISSESPATRTTSYRAIPLSASVDGDQVSVTDVSLIALAVGVPGVLGRVVSTAGALPACSAAQLASQASAEFQLIATSLTEYASMWSTKHFWAAQPASCAAAIGSCSSLFGPPENEPGGAIGSDAFGLVRPEPVVHVLDGLLAVAGDVGLVERVAALEVVERGVHAGAVLRLAGEVVGEREGVRVVGDLAVRAPVVDAAGVVGRRVGLARGAGQGRVGERHDGRAGGGDVGGRQPVRDQRERRVAEAAGPAPVVAALREAAALVQRRAGDVGAVGGRSRSSRRARRPPSRTRRSRRCRRRRRRPCRRSRTRSGSGSPWRRCTPSAPRRGPWRRTSGRASSTAATPAPPPRPG